MCLLSPSLHPTPRGHFRVHQYLPSNGPSAWCRAGVPAASRLDRKGLRNNTVRATLDTRSSSGKAADTEDGGGEEEHVESKQGRPTPGEPSLKASWKRVDLLARAAVESRAKVTISCPF